MIEIISKNKKIQNLILEGNLVENTKLQLLKTILHWNYLITVKQSKSDYVKQIIGYSLKNKMLPDYFKDLEH